MNNINFESDYNDMCLKRIYECLGDYNKYSAYVEVPESELTALFKTHIGDYQTMEKGDFLYVKSINNFEAYYTRVLIGKDVCVVYNTSEDVDDEHPNDVMWIAASIGVYFKPGAVDIVNEFMSQLKEKVLLDEAQTRFYMISINKEGYVLNPDNIIDTDIDLDMNYGKKFVVVHNDIMNKLTKDNSGMILLYGDPGTGKTFYLRHLIKVMSVHKNIIFIPSFLVDQLANPELISFMERQKDSVFVIEYQLPSRDESVNVQAISNLINMASGLLNDITRTQVVMTFNMDRKMLDKDLLRPGRLVYEHKFDKLSIDDANRLAKHIGKEVVYTKPMTIAEIYMGDSIAVKKSKKKVGFREESDDN